MNNLHFILFERANLLVTMLYQKLGSGSEYYCNLGRCYFTTVSLRQSLSYSCRFWIPLSIFYS